MSVDPQQNPEKERPAQPLHINEISLPGCTPTPLASYLKALAALRLVAEACPDDGGDPEATGSWRDDVFVLRTRLTSDELRTFFLERYRPTPLVAPWNGGGGFYFQEGKLKEKDPVTGKKIKTGIRDQPTEATRTVEAILRGRADRLEPYRSVVETAKQVISEFALSEAPENNPDQNQKDRFIQRFRNLVNEHGQLAMDCVVLLASEGADFPPLMGTGGNDQNLDFTNNFMQRLTELFDVESGAAKASASSWLDSALFGGVATAVSDSSVGQFAPGSAGGPNGSTGFESSAGVNAWDFVLAIEGAVMFAASVVRRLESREASVLAAPFTVYERLGTVGAASAGDDSDSRREVWMPLWTRAFAIEELRSLLAEGRAALNGRAARDGLDFARAAAQLGVDRGISAFQRYAILKRQGKNHLATPLNRIYVRRNPDADLINELERRNWLASVQRYARDDNAPNAFRSAGRQLDTALFALAQQASRLTLQTVLRQLGRIEAALSISPKSQEAVRAPMPRLSSVWAIKSGGDRASDSTEFRIAAALAGLQLVNEKRHSVLHARRHLARVSESLNAEGARGWEPTSALAVWGAGPLAGNLAALLHRRRLEAAIQGAEGETLASACGATCDDLAAFLANETDDARIAELFAGLACVDLHDPENPSSSRDPVLPPGFALLKIFFTSERLLHALKLDWLPEDRNVRLPAEIPARLAGGDVHAAVRLAWRRLRTFGVKLPGRDPPHVVGADGPRWLATLCIPLAFGEIARLIRSLNLEAEEQPATELRA